jgi:Niemann-Pick C1 protein
LLPQVTSDVLAWEAEFNRKMAELKSLLDNEDFTVYYSAARSHADAGKAMVLGERNKQIIGCVLMFIYMQLVLSKLSWVEARVSMHNSVNLIMLFY